MRRPLEPICRAMTRSRTGAGVRLPLLGAQLFLVAVSVGAAPASALTPEEAREKCRETVGKPIVQSCMWSKGYGQGASRSPSGDKEAVREACRAKASPKVKECMQKAMTAAHGRANVPVALPEERSIEAPVLDAPAAYVPPPRTIGDIKAILDGEKPDQSKIEQLKVEADTAPPTGASRADLAWFHYTRGTARAQLGRLDDALADAVKAVELARTAGDANLLGRLQQFAGQQYQSAGNPRQALAVYSSQVRDTDTKGARGYLFGGNLQISLIHVQMGDLVQAEIYLRRNLALIQEARTSGMPGWRTSYAKHGQSWEASVENHRGSLYEARGQYREAEAAYRLAERRRRASIKDLADSKYPPPVSQLLYNADALVLAQARMKARQGRLAESEADARRALLSRLKEQGKYHPGNARFLRGLADILIEQGRYQEAEQLLRIALEINYRVGVIDSSESTAYLLASLGTILTLRSKAEEAMEVYAKLDAAIASWEPQRREALELNATRIFALYDSGQVEAGLAAAQALLRRQIARVGEKHYDAASARGTLAVGYARAGRNAEAMAEFKGALPVLLAAAQRAQADPSLVLARRGRLQNIVEAYISLVSKNEKSFGADFIRETFSLADTIRGQSVQQALAASSARMNAKDPELAELIRKEQDLALQVNALLGTLNNVLALAPAERDEEGVKTLNATIDKLREERNAARNEIARRFPSYADLIDPKPPNLEATRAALRPDEALLSFYFGHRASFVWVVRKDGPAAFAPIGATIGTLDSVVRKLREPLEAQPATFADYPAFDLALAHELYELLLAPLEPAWKPAKNLIVVTNGALGLLPLSLLPTAPSTLKHPEGPLFASYREVPWLARTHAVTMVPSAAALRTLRSLPPGSSNREPLIGFGDPYFSVEQAQAAAEQAPIQVAAVETRGLSVKRRAVPRTAGVDSVELARLPRLPDTADELKSIAGALNLDPAQVLRLGKDANEQVVRDTDLSRYRIVAFSTHGLLPGDLNGLTQPALALSAPEVVGIDGDGLLTMDNILPLKLDADWVVLSACNTGAGAQVGAEAASGLGRAFFYAGSRALLVTNWAVESASARDLVSDIFRRQAADPKLGRGEALRQAMMGLLDGSGYVHEGKTLYTYGHPMFWAPYSLIGDGG